MTKWIDGRSVVAALYSTLDDLRWAFNVRQRDSDPDWMPAEDSRRIGQMQMERLRSEAIEDAEDAGDYRNRQRLAYKLEWLTVRAPSDAKEPPRQLDASVAEHVTLALNVVGDYDAALENVGEYADCLYRPASVLPYPSDAIRSCCEFLIRIADGTLRPLHHDQALIAAERDALGVALFSLDYFSDSPEPQIPKQKMQNLAFARQQEQAPSSPNLKPKTGDLVVGKNPEHNDYVDQVIGVDNYDQWMVYGKSGSQLQIVHNAALSRWEEVQLLTPPPMSSRFKTNPRAIAALSLQESLANGEAANGNGEAANDNGVDELIDRDNQRGGA